MKIEKNNGAGRRVQRAKGKGQRAKGKEPVANSQQPATSSQTPIAIGAVTNENSTVFKIVKPSTIGTIFFTEGCISGSQAIRACLMIRIYNN